MRATEIRKDIEAKELREAAKKEKNSRIVRRLLGLAHLLEGGSRSEAQKISCLNINNFRRWIQRFNAEGIEGLEAKTSPGRPPKLPPEVAKQLKEKVLEGPQAEEGLARYRIIDLQRFLKEEHGITMGMSGIWYVLQDLNLSWKTGRQRHPKSDEATQEAFKKTSLSK